MSSIQRVILIALLGVNTLSCGGEEPTRAPFLLEPSAEGTMENQMPGEALLSPALGLVLPGAAAATSRELLDALVYGVVIATQSVGASEMVTTGTITFQGDAASYAPEPSDQLVIVIANARYVYEVRRFEINTQADSVETIFLEAHNIDSQVLLVGTPLNLSLTSRVTNRGYQTELRGTVGHETLGTLAVDLIQRNANETDVGSNGGVAYDSGTVLSGSIRSMDGRFDSLVNERSFYVSVALGSVAEERHDFVDTRFTLDDKVYAANDVYLRSAFLDGCPNDPEFWSAQGTVSENNTVIAEMRLIQDPTGFTFALVVEGAQVPVDRYSFCR